MKLLAEVIIVMLCVGCKIIDSSTPVNINALFEEPSYFDKKKVNVIAIMDIIANQTIVLYDETQNVYLDMVYIGSEKDVQDFKRFDNKCVIALGQFREYNSDFVGIGHLTSQVGLFKAEKVRRCKQTKGDRSIF